MKTVTYVVGWVLLFWLIVGFALGYVVFTVGLLLLLALLAASFYGWRRRPRTTSRA